MVRDVIQLRPEIEELIREIAARPDSVLLRVPRGSEWRVLQDDRATAGLSDSRLSSAERHLLALHREEVAFLLRQAAWCRVATSPQGQTFVCRRQAPGRVIAVPEPRVVSVHASSLLRDADQGQRVGAEFELLELCVAGEPGRWPLAEDLCAAAHRLAPSFSGRMIAGTAYYLAGRAQVAQLAFQDALNSAPTREDRGIAYNNLAEALDAQDEWGRAQVATIRAIAHHGNLIAAHVGCMWYSIRMGDVRRADSAARDLEQLLQADPLALDEHARRFVACADRMLRGLGPSHRQVLALLRERTGPLAGRILHALG